MGSFTQCPRRNLRRLVRYFAQSVHRVRRTHRRSFAVLRHGGWHTRPGSTYPCSSWFGVGRSPNTSPNTCFPVPRGDREIGIEPVVYGAPYSVYVRAVRLALEEEGVPYRLVPIDVFTPDGPPKEYLNRQPFGRIPAFEHGGFQLYEAGAITRYVDEAFPGPVLQPTAPELRARTHQVISILDSYAYRTLVWDIYVERVSVPKDGRRI
jgi:Glutathione S-transferase, N-terminal domain